MSSTTALAHPVLPRPARRPVRRGSFSFLARTAFSAVVSFEMIVVLYLYSNVFQALLPPLPIDSTVVFFVLSVGVGGLVVLREGIYLRGFYLVVALVPYLLWAALSLAWTPSRILVYDNLKLLFSVDLWLLITGAMIIAHKRERMMRFLALTALMSLVVALLGLGIYVKYGSFKYAGWGIGRVYNEWGRAAANGTVVFLMLFLRSRLASARQLVVGALLGLCMAFIFVSSSRSALLSVALPAVVFMAVNAAPAGRRGFALSRAQILLLLFVAMVVTAVVALISSGYQIDTMQRLMKVFNQAENTDILLQANRFDYYKAALHYFLQSPLIGNGVRSFTVMHRGFESEGVHAHNIFLELLGDTGVVGFVLFMLLLLMAARPLSFARLRSDPMLLCVVMLFACRFTAAMFGNDLAYQHPLFLAIGLLALKTAPRPASAAPAAARVEDDEGEEEGDAAAGASWPGPATAAARRPA
jgi:O-antigen ligase